jgi:hypothetical protein
MDPDGLATAARLSKTHKRWWSSRNVVGLAYARKIRRGRLDDPCLQVLVRRKRHRDKIKSELRIPETLGAKKFGVPKLWTDVLEVGRFQPERIATADRPAHPGFDIGDQVSSGTLTGLVRDQASGQPLGLSCAHVFSGGSGQLGDPVLCPSEAVAEALDVSDRAHIGTLLRIGALSPSEADAGTNMDAAVFQPDDGALLSPVLAVLGRRPRAVRPQVTLGLPVTKIGAVSGKTTGEVKQIHLLAYLDYDFPSGTTQVPIAELIGVSSFTDPGDSGAPVLDANCALVGMHIGSYEGLSVCIPMQRVLDGMGCRVA